MRGVHEAFLVLLQIPVVGKGQALDHCEQGHESSVHPAGLAAHEFGNVRVLLLGHDGGACGIAVGQLHEAEVGVGPEDDFLAKAREVGHDEGAVEKGFEHKVPVRDSVHGIGVDAAKAHFLCHRGRIQGVGCAGKGCSTKGRDAHALQRILDALVVPLEHEGIGKEVVRKAHRLGWLQMGAARQDVLSVILGPCHKALAQGEQKALPFGEGVAHIEPVGEANLIVAATTGVQALAHLAHELGEPGLDVHVHVFELGLPGELAPGDLLCDHVEALFEGLAVFRREDPLAGQHAGMGLGGSDVLEGQGPVVGFGFGIGSNCFLGSLAKATTPACVGFHVMCVSR